MSAAPAPPAAFARKALPVDRGLAFSEATRKLLGSACIRCEERYPTEGAHSVVVVVVDRDAPTHREKLSAAFEELFGRNVTDPLAPVTLEVIDRATDEAMARLVVAGLISSSTRAVRELGVSDEGDTQSLTEAERRMAEEHRRQAGRKLKMAALVGGGGLIEEEREALLHAAAWLGKALAVENRIAEPESLEDALRPPLGHCWGETLPVIQSYAADSSVSSSPAVTALRALVGQAYTG